MRESLNVLHGSIALLTITAPGEVEVCPCCGVRVERRLRSRVEVGEWNRTASRRYRRFAAYLRRRMWVEHHVPPPRVVVRLAQRQERGADHLHLVALARTPGERERVRLWVELYRAHHVRFGFGFVDDPFRRRRGGRDMVFEVAGRAGAYLGQYLSGGQLERYVSAADRSFRPLWVSPVLQARSGWSMARCRMVRQAYVIARGLWDRRTWYGTPLLPSWWHTGTQRSWVCSVTGWDGVPGSASGAHG